MIRSFADKETEQVFFEKKSRRYGSILLVASEPLGDDYEDWEEIDEGEEESRAGEKEKDDKAREEGGAEEEGREKGGTQAQGAGEKARSRSCSDARSPLGAYGSVMDRAYGFGYRHRQQRQLDAFRSPELRQYRRERRGCRPVEQARQGQ